MLKNIFYERAQQTSEIFFQMSEIFFGVKGAIYYVAIAKVIFSHVKISSFRAKAHLAFHWCLYNKANYVTYITVNIMIVNFFQHTEVET